MDNDKLMFLLDGLKYMGFGDRPTLNEQLEERIANDIPEFQLYTESFYDEDYRLETILHFRRSDRYDMYFFNKYEALLRRGDDPKTDRTQTFYVSRGTGITLKEAFNLLQGRAVNKTLTSAEGEKYNAWLQLNFEEIDINNNYKVRQFNKQYGFDLEKVLEKYPIRELQLEDSKVLLLKALKRGNLQPVHFLKTNRAEKMFIDACPQFKTINIYSSVAKAMQKLAKRPIAGVKREVAEHPGGPAHEERKEEEPAPPEEWVNEPVEESIEEGIERIEGAIEGAIEGTKEGATKGTIEGAIAGTIEGAIAGTTEGAIAGTTEGAMEGAIEKATAEGIREGVEGEAAIPVGKPAAKKGGRR